MTEEILDVPLDPAAIRLFYDPPGTLRMTIQGERSYPGVQLYQAWPLSEPGRHLSLVNGKGEEITMLDSLAVLEPEARAAAEEELRRRYLTARILAIPHIKSEFGVTYWDVLTDKGPREFVVQSLSESCVWLSDTHLLITDVDGTRFEIADRAGLDPASQMRLDAVL